MDLKYLTTGLKANAGGFDAIITSSVVDVDGEVVVPTGIRNRAEYLANPLVFWAHEWAYDRAAEPIGRATRLDVFADRIESSAEFAPTPKGQNVRALVTGGFVSRTSIGFNVPDGGVQMIGGRPHITAWDLMEYSVVPLPANSEAVITGVKSALTWLADQMGTDEAVEPVGLIAAADAAGMDLIAIPGMVIVRDGRRVVATLRRRRVAVLRH